MLTVNRKKLIGFFDVVSDCSKGHATSVAAVAGEEMNAACFRHYAESRGACVEILQDRVTTGRARGPRLDRWIKVRCDGREFLYQTEIKNWSAHAIGGQNLRVDANPDEIADYKQMRWEFRCRDSKSHGIATNPSCAKVVVRMQPPDHYNNLEVQPLLIFWEAIGPQEQADDHLLCTPVNEFPEWHYGETSFDHLWIFSVSSYLRNLAVDRIDLPMPQAAHRLRILNFLFSLRDPNG